MFDTRSGSQVAAVPIAMPGTLRAVGRGTGALAVQGPLECGC